MDDSLGAGGQSQIYSLGSELRESEASERFLHSGGSEARRVLRSQVIHFNAVRKTMAKGFILSENFFSTSNLHIHRHPFLSPWRGIDVKS